MSAGEQLIAVLVDSIGALISALIGSIFGAFETPFFDLIFGAGGAQARVRVIEFFQGAVTRRTIASIALLNWRGVRVA